MKTIILILISLLLTTCSRVVQEDTHVSQDPNHYDSIYSNAKTKKDKLKILEDIKKTNNPEISIVLIRAFFDTDSEIVNKAFEVFNFFRLSTLSNVNKYFFDYLNDWWANNAKIILKQMDYNKKYEDFIKDLKDKGYETHQFVDNPLYFLIEESTFKVLIAELLTFFKLNKDFEAIEKDYNKSNYSEDDWEKIQQFLLKKKEEYQIEKMRFFWAFWLIGYFKITDSIPILVNYLYQYHYQFNQQTGLNSFFKDPEKPYLPKIEEKKENDKSNLYINYEWISLYSLAQFKNEKWISFIFNWIFDDNPLIQELVVVNLGLFYPSKYLSLFSKLFHSNEKFISNHMRSGILWLFARIQSQDLIYILTNRYKNEHVDVEEKEKKINWLEIQKLSLINQFNWVFPPNIVLENIEYRKEWTLDEKIKRDISLQILKDFDNLYLLSDQDRKKVLDYFYPYIEDIDLDNLELQKKILVLIYQYGKGDMKKNFQKFLNQLLYSKKDFSKSLKDIENMREFVLRCLIDINPEEILDQYISWLEDPELSSKLKYILIENIFKLKLGKYFNQILSFYKDNFPLKDEKNKDKKKEEKKIIPVSELFSLHQLLNEFADSKIIEELILNKENDNYLKNEALKALDKFSDQIKNKYFLIQLFDETSSEDIKKSILQIFYNIKYQEAEDLVFRISFLEGISTNIRFEAYKVLSLYTKKRFYLEKILGKMKNFSNQERITALKSFIFFDSEKDIIVKFIRKFFSYVTNKSEKLVSLFILLYFHDINDKEWVEFANLVEPVVSEDQKILNDFFETIGIEKKNQWIQYIFEISPLPFRSLFKKFIFIQPKKR